MAGPVIWSGADGKLIASGTLKDKRNIPYLQQPEKNYISMTGWGDSGGGLTVVETTTASELPREFTSPTGLKIAAGVGISVGDYVYKDFTLDDIDQNRKLNIKWAQKLLSTYAAGDLIVYIADQSSRATPLHTPLVSSIPGYDLDFDANGFDTATTATLSLVIKNVSLSSGEGIVISDVIVGPGTVQAVPAIGPEISYTPTFGGIGANYNSLKSTYQRVGDKMLIRGSLNVTAAVTATITVELPSGYTIDTSNLQINSEMDYLGDAFASDSSIYYDGAILYSSSNGVRIRPKNGGTGSWNATTPFTWASGDDFSWKFIVPIAEWAGAPNYAGSNDVEYASSADSVGGWDAAAGAEDTIYGTSGSAISAALTADRDKVVQWQTNISPTDQFDLWLDESGNGRWKRFNSRVPGLYFPSVNFGWRIIHTASNQTTVRFFQYALPGTTYNSTTGAVGWNTHLGTSGKWMITKAKAGAAVGFGLATSSASGLVSRETYESVVLSSSGAGSVSGTLYLSRVGKSVNISAAAALTHTNLSSAASASGVIPSAYRPAGDVTNTFLIGGSVVAMVTVSSNGTITFTYRDYAGTLTAQTGTSTIPTISYAVN